MNELGVSLVWCVVQVTLVAGVSWLLAGAVSRRAPGAGGPVIAGGMAVVMALSLGALSPWPRWTSKPAELATSHGDAARVSDLGGTESSRAGSARASRAVEIASGSSLTTSAREFWRALVAELEHQPVGETSSATWRWTGLLFIAAGGALIIGVLRGISGVLAVKWLSRRAVPLEDSSLREEVDVLCAELSCARQVRLFESRELSTAAAIGWLRPAILLPSAWRTWTAAERRAVLAHELAHVAHNDFLGCAVAQVSLVLHFYHPLVHGLVRRWRLEMELAADARAATLVGEPRKYLQTLAHMALRQSDRPLGWPARTFLPTRSTFLRRIEMLRETRALAPRRPRALTWAPVVAVLVTGIVAAGLRGGGNQVPAANAQAPAAVRTAVHKPPQWLPADTAAVLVARPADLAARPEIREFAEMLLAAMTMPLQLTPFQVEQLEIVLLTRDDGTQGFREPALVLQLVAGTKLTLGNGDQPVTLARFAGHSYQLQAGRAWMQADDRTLLIADEETLKLLIVNGSTSKSPLVSGPRWEAAQVAPLAVAAEMATLRKVLEHAPAYAAPIAPLWKDAQRIYAGAELAEELKLTAIADCVDAAAVTRVTGALDSLLGLGKGALTQIRAQVPAAPDGDASQFLPLIELAEKFLSTARYEMVPGPAARLTTSAVATPESLAAAHTALTGARRAAARLQDMNNVKQIMLAMHNYHDTHGHFPPAVCYGKTGAGGKVPHSWRVELLPYLEQAALYEMYHFDEPWDSDHNKQVLARMPAMFRSPMDEVGSKNASYFVPVGPDTVFSDKEGVKLADISDGTSVTVCVIEAKRNIPWTKPEDIAFDPDKELPKFGGWTPAGFTVGMCDGSARFLSAEIKEAVLKNLIEKADGEIVLLP